MERSVLPQAAVALGAAAARGAAVRNCLSARAFPGIDEKGTPMNSIIYLVGLVVVIMFILSFFGFR